VFLPTGEDGRFEDSRARKTQLYCVGFAVNSTILENDSGEEPNRKLFLTPLRIYPLGDAIASCLDPIF
jgi:hypothetical protein